MAKTIKCRKCKSANVQLVGNDVNLKKTKASTSINLNPLKPLTVFNHKEKTKKKRSKAKTTAAVLTGGASLFVTGGTKDNRGREFSCLDCGSGFKQR